MRTWRWILPLALAASSRALPPGPLRALAFALGALLVEWAFRGGIRTWPVYRRHLLIFLGLSALALGVERAFLPWLLDTLAAAGGLALASLPALRSRRLGGFSWARGTMRRPDPSRDLILVADPHWSDELRGLEAATAAHPEADWLFLGDAFDVWVGIPGMETPAQAAFLAWVDARRAAGRWVGFWMGNREYFLDRHAGRFDLMGEGTGGGLPEEGLAFEHGDLVNASDWKYRLWNGLSRSGILWGGFRLLPAARAAAIAQGLERKLRTTNKAYKLHFPREAFRAAAAEHPGKTFLTGHFHTREAEANGLALPWAYEGRYQVWRNGRVEDLD